MYYEKQIIKQKKEANALLIIKENECNDVLDKIDTETEQH